nr:hypothetical protein [Candidatus Sigynarchaeota archaeon]
MTQRAKKCNLFQRQTTVGKAIVLQLVVAAIIINTFLVASFYRGNAPAAPPEVILDNAQAPISALSELDNGTTWFARDSYVLEPTLDSEMAGTEDSHGNIYAPDILFDDGMWKLWYGGQSSNGHDSIHFATSADGVRWQKYGTIIPTGVNNHVNDPSVVKVNGTYYMYYTVAPVAELDRIWLATSNDGLNWTVYGQIIGQGTSGTWNSLKVGRPSVLYMNNTFKMWFDGTEEDPANPGQVKPGTGRHVGYATSVDGITWTIWPANPVFLNSGAIDVEYFNKTYVVVEESGVGIWWRKGTNETSFESSPRLLFRNMNTTFDAFGHVTPFIFVQAGKWVATFTGAATVRYWDRNRIDAWYPMRNITLSIDNGGGTFPTSMRGWASSSTSLKWVFSTADAGKNVTLAYHRAAAMIDQVVETLAAGTRNLYFLPGTGHIAGA